MVLRIHFWLLVRNVAQVFGGHWWSKQNELSGRGTKLCLLGKDVVKIVALIIHYLLYTSADVLLSFITHRLSKTNLQ